MILSFIALYEYGCNKIKKMDPLVFAVCTWSLFLFVVTEGLSAIHCLNRIGTIIIWGCAFILSGIYILYLIKQKRISIRLKENGISVYGCYILIACVLCVSVAYISLHIAPFNWDSMTYHMARISNWIQNGSVDYYPTNIERQLYSPVFSEYVILNTMLILKSDVCSNFVQTVSYSLSAILLYKIAKKSGLPVIICIIVDFLFMTMPMAIAQSVTTQVDLNGTLWLLTFILAIQHLFELEKLELKGECILSVSICALSVGFGYLTKSTVCLGMVPFLIALLIIRIKRKDRWTVLLVSVAIGGGLIILLALPTFIRNYIFTETLFASDYMGSIAIGTLHPRLVIVNIFKNWALLAVNSFNRDMLASMGVGLAKILNVDLDAAPISFTGDFFNQLPASYHCDFASCFIPALIFPISLAIGFVFFVAKKGKMSNQATIMSTVAAIFAGLTVIKYQVWGGRLLLPFAALMCLFIGLILYEFFVKSDVCKIIVLVFCFLIFIMCAKEVVPAIRYQTSYLVKNNQSTDRFKMYFLDRDQVDIYDSLCSYIEDLHVEKIGIYLGGDTYEYPIWTRLKNDKTEIIQVVPDMEYESAMPECILVIQANLGIEEDLYFHGQKFLPVYTYDSDSYDYCVLLPSSL